MCFYIDNQYPYELVAVEDIKCFKLLHPEKKIKGFSYATFFTQFETPYQGCPIRFMRPLEVSTFDIWNNSEINRGIHSYSALKVFDNNNFESNCLLFDAIIPKGTAYYYDSLREEYVSKKLIILPTIVKKGKRTKTNFTLALLPYWVDFRDAMQEAWNHFFASH